ncbi:MAG: hypothetical protein SFT68_05320 [Rickettsiaceae bacterium]|nr:hypothetical protein [Rickettsiaceae bacterium]
MSKLIGDLEDWYFYSKDSDKDSLSDLGLEYESDPGLEYASNGKLYLAAPDIESGISYNFKAKPSYHEGSSLMITNNVLEEDVNICFLVREVISWFLREARDCYNRIVDNFYI